MLYVRVVSPQQETEQLVAVLRACSGVENLVVLPGAAQRVIGGRRASRAPAAPAVLAAGTPSLDGDGIDRGAGSSR